MIIKILQEGRKGRYKERISEEMLYPFGQFCKRGNYCSRCHYECPLKMHKRHTKDLWDKSESERGYEPILGEIEE